MATRKKAATTGGALTLWEQEMAATAKVQGSAEKPMGLARNISFKNGRLIIDENPVPGDSIDVVILATMVENQYYTGAYDPNSVQIPVCYAFGDMKAEDPEEGMAPHEEAEDKQGDENGQCAECWANQMGSADVGRGKACKNVRRLLLVSADAVADAKELKDAEVRGCKIPVTSVKNWANYVRNVTEETSRPFWGIVTRISVLPDPRNQFKVTFEFVELVNFDQELYDGMKKKVSEAEKGLGLPYQKPTEQELKPTGRAAKAMAKQGAGKAAAPAAKKAAPAPAAKKVAPAGKQAANAPAARKRAF
jgi:hypothetical protein